MNRYAGVLVERLGPLLWSHVFVEDDLLLFLHGLLLCLLELLNFLLALAQHHDFGALCEQ